MSYGDGRGAASALGSGFSKASFVSTDQKDEVDLDDPDFWQKAIGLVEGSNDNSDEVCYSVYIWRTYVCEYVHLVTVVDWCA